MTEPTPADIDAKLRAAGRGRLDLDAPPARTDSPAEDTTPAPIDMDDAALDALLLDKASRRETLSDPAVRVRLARRDPVIAAQLDEWEARALAAEERAEAKMAAIAAGAPRPMPLPGGGAAPIPSAPPSGDDLFRAAIAAANGHHVDPRLRPFVSATASSATITAGG